MPLDEPDTRPYDPDTETLHEYVMRRFPDVELNEERMKETAGTTTSYFNLGTAVRGAEASRRLRCGRLLRLLRLRR